MEPETAVSTAVRPEDTCREVLQALKKAGIASQEGTEDLYSFDPPAELAATLDALADCYAKNLVEATRLIHSRVDKRARQLSDAFSWRSEK